MAEPIGGIFAEEKKAKEVAMVKKRLGIGVDGQ